MNKFYKLYQWYFDFEITCKVTNHLVDRYFTLSSVWRIAGVIIILLGFLIPLSIPGYSKNKGHDPSTLKKRRSQNYQASGSFKKSFKNGYKLYKEALYYYNKKHYSQASRSFKNLARLNSPIKDYGYYYLGLCSFYKKQYKRAAGNFARIRVRYPDSRFLAKAVDFESKCYLKLGSVNKLIGYYSKELKKSRSAKILKRYHYYLGSAYHRLNNHAKAIIFYLCALKLADDPVWSKLIIADINALVKNSSLKLKAEQWLEIGVGYYLSNNYSKAISILEKLGSLNNSALEFKRIYCLTICYYKQKRIRSLKKLLQYSYKRYQNVKNKIIPVAYFYSKLLDENDFAKASIGYKHTVKSNHIPLVVESAKKMASFYHRKRDFKKKSYYLTYLAHYEPEAIWSYFNQDLQRQKRKPVIHYYPEIVNLIGDHKLKSKYLYWLGIAAFKLKSYVQSQQFFKESYLCYPYSYYGRQSLVHIEKYSKKRLFTEKVSRLYSKMKNAEYAFFNSPAYQSRYNHSFYPIFKKKIHPVLSRFLLLHENKAFQPAAKELDHFLDSVSQKEKYYRGLMYYFYNKGNQHYYNRFALKLIQYLNGKKGHHYIPKTLVQYYDSKYYKKLVYNESDKELFSKISFTDFTAIK